MTSDFTIPAAATATNPLTSANVLAADNALLGLINDYKNGVKGFDVLKFYKSTATLASDTLALAATNMTRYVVVDTQGAAATDDLSTISGGSDGQVLYLIAANAGRVITVKHNVGNIKFSAGVDATLSTDKVVKLFYNGTNWSDEAAAVAAVVTPALVINTARTAQVSSTTSITISSIPATYKHLMLLLELRSDIAGAVDSVLLRFNGDTTAGNYYTEYLIASGASPTAAEVLGATYGGVVLGHAAAGNTAPANVNGFVAVTISNYASTSLQRALNWLGAVRSGTGTGTVKALSGAGFWLNAAAAISSITVVPQGGTNIVAGSAWTLYGYN